MFDLIFNKKKRRLRTNFSTFEYVMTQKRIQGKSEKFSNKKISLLFSCFFGKYLMSKYYEKTRRKFFFFFLKNFY